jgi:hypothetical protein
VAKALTANSVGTECGDEYVLCQNCADCHCADAEIKETAMKRKDIELIGTMLTTGVYEDQCKHSRERTIQSKTLRDILERLTKDPPFVVALIEKIGRESNQASEKDGRHKCADRRGYNHRMNKKISRQRVAVETYLVDSNKSNWVPTQKPKI